ncbi:MAG: UDP-2,4-diacetamido-2,4,6-trideoxy-beta-L-altropyranose hydrolase [Nitrospinae bacterium]|nr:UDP-2,4-diacetamido-2,4,6-trideoxy-beta-L-altropyranose hydrolase [Nitrospinota bacterium]MBF0633605.1 UDP-2,4-diacetamido-2,4,6-trideoxy-beta-L-altropyranose hydrolase [Nitrospinota bacterium]
MPVAIFRADASASMGVGHAMRTLALAQAWIAQGGVAIYAMVCGVSGFAEKIKASGSQMDGINAEPGSMRDAELTAGLARSAGADWLVVDGYQFGAAYHKAVNSGGWRELIVDDEGLAGSYEADMVLNQNFHASESLYVNRGGGTRLLLGPEYALIQRDFFKWRELSRTSPPVARRILVTMGGGDLNNVTRKVVEALGLMSAGLTEARVVIGGANPNYDSVTEAARSAGPSIRVETDIVEMGEAMTWADIAITAGGSSIYELAFLGTPFIMITTADNQKPVEQALIRLGASPCLGWHDGLSPEKIARALEGFAVSQSSRLAMAGRMASLVDGQGSVRVVRTMMDETRI